MENKTVKFLVDCDNKDSRGVYKAGTTQTVREDSARFWIDRRMAVQVATPAATTTKTATAKTPAQTGVTQAAAELQKAASDLEAAAEAAKTA